MSIVRKDDEKMKENEEKIKNNKIDKKKILTRVMAVFLLTAMILASCSTCIYYVVANVK